MIITRVPSCKLHEREFLHATFHPEKTKAFRETTTQIGTPGGVQHDRPACIGVSGNYRASSERFPNESRRFMQCPTREDLEIYGNRPFAGQLARKIRTKIDAQIDTKLDAKSVPGAARGTQNRLRTGPGSLSGRPVATKSIPMASRERLGSVLGRPRRALGASGDSPRAPRDARKGARERPGAPRGDQNRRQVASRSEKIDFFSRGSFAQRRRSDFSTIFIDFRFFRKVSEPSEVLRLPAKTEVWPIATRVESLARCNLEQS